MLGFTHFFNNDGNEQLNALCHEFKAEGYAVYYATCEAVCAAINIDRKADSFSIYFSLISKRSHVGLRKTKKILSFLLENLEKSDKVLEKSDVFLKISDFQISQLPEIVRFFDYKISKDKLTKIKEKKPKINKGDRVNDADLSEAEGLPPAVFLKGKLLEEWGEEFIDTYLGDAMQYYYDNNLKGSLENFIKRSFERTEEKYGCRFKAMKRASQF